jgi:hypothetical protein
VGDGEFLPIHLVLLILFAYQFIQLERFLSRIARFSLVQYTIVLKYTKRQQNKPNGHNLASLILCAKKYFLSSINLA